MEHGGYREMIEKWTIYGEAVFLHRVEHQILYSILIFLICFSLFVTLSLFVSVIDTYLSHLHPG